MEVANGPREGPPGSGMALFIHGLTETVGPHHRIVIHDNSTKIVFTDAEIDSAAFRPILQYQIEIGFKGVLPHPFRRFRHKHSLVLRSLGKNGDEHAVPTAAVPIITVKAHILCHHFLLHLLADCRIF